MTQTLSENEIARKVVNASIKVHKEVGIGLLEKVYEICLYKELKRQGLQVRRQVSIGIQYDGELIPNAFKADLIVENKVILELKTVEKITELHFAQVLTYLRLSELKLGLLLNFYTSYMGNGIRRVVNGLKD